MDKELEKRLADVVERLRNLPTPPEPDRDKARRQAREKVLAELPRLMGRIGDVVAEINDGLAEAGMALRLTMSDNTPLAEAVYSLRMTGAPNFEPVLMLIVDGEGRARALLERDHHRALLSTVSIFDLDKAILANLTLTLLESHGDR
jgi:hypothetical protein